MAIDPSTIGKNVLPPGCRPFRPIGTVANRAVPQISPWLSAADAIVALRSALADESLVVDGDGTPVGMVTLSKLESASPASDVERSMTPIAVVLHESVPVSIAASLMSSLPTDRIAVVGDGRRAIGVLAGSDLLRWIVAETTGRSRA